MSLFNSFSFVSVEGSVQFPGACSCADTISFYNLWKGMELEYCNPMWGGCCRAEWHAINEWFCSYQGLFEEHDWITCVNTLDIAGVDDLPF